MRAKVRVLCIFGTRPEAIKMSPVVHALTARSDIEPVVCVTAQHRQLLDQVLELFEIAPQFDLNIMKPNQDLFDITVNCLQALRDVYRQVQPDVVLVHGDTSTAFAAALAAYYLKIPVGHVEAGLRTGDKYSPFPEEMNRHLVGPIADFHFAPTARAVANLRLENTAPNKIFQTGNSAIDALHWVLKRVDSTSPMPSRACGRKLILMTAHRRENFGAPLESIFAGVLRFAQEHTKQYQIVYPVHPNPNVLSAARAKLGGQENINLIDPVGYREMAMLLNACEFVLTDSGGIQEEAPSLGKPVLVLRETTERPEATEAGCAALIGSDATKLYETMMELSASGSILYKRMSQATNPFGNGTTGTQIAEIIANHA